MADDVGRHGSGWVTLAIFCIISFFNPEILTGSTRVESFISPLTWLGLVFYGFQVAIIADFVEKRGFSWRTVYLLGLIYGVFEEGFAVMTMESPKPPGFTNIFRVEGLNVAWTTYIATFHAVISVLSSILIIKLIWPRRVSGGFLKRRHFAVAIPALAVVYFMFIWLVTRTYVPEASALAILAVTCVVLGFLANRRFSLPAPVKDFRLSTRNLIGIGVILSFASSVLPYLLAGFWLPLVVYLTAMAILYYVFFGKVDRGLTGQNKLILFAILVGTWLAFGTFFRTPFSNVVSYVGVALQLYLGWRSVKRPA